ncbi:MAG: polyprenyl synthetase family protein [Planctomycetaceae bacterium]
MSIAPNETRIDDAPEAVRREAQPGPRSNGRPLDDEGGARDDAAEHVNGNGRPKRQRRSTSHLKDVPDTLELRERIKAEAEKYAEQLDHSRPFNKNELERHARMLLERMGQPEGYLGFAMVLIGNFFWKRQFMAIPYERRLLLLPHCLKHAEGCPAEYDEFGLDCERCGACSIADYKGRAEQLGYKVLVAEGSPIVLKIIVSGYIDGILGVACLNVLEKAIDKVLIAGVPSYAIPLHSGDCKNTTLDESWVWDVLEKYEPLPDPLTTSYVPLMRASNRLFEERFETLLPRLRSRSDELRVTSDEKKQDALASGNSSPVTRHSSLLSHSSLSSASPLAQTEEIAYDWLANGGKRFRPFITLAAYDAVTGGKSLHAAASQAEPLDYSDAVSRVAMAIEAFHKASLVHDDIEDDDPFRYGRETLHRRYDLGTAINVGDYLIGVGYRLVNSARAEVGADVTCDVLDRMATAHIKLCDGQGAEMAWQTAADKHLTPMDALSIYALKTSPAFEAALYAGLRMAGSTAAYDEMVPAFSRHLGVGFQILNDLTDWRGDRNNKLVAGQDAEALRPTLLLALAMQAVEGAQRRELDEVLSGAVTGEYRVGRLRRIFESCGVFEKAEALVDKSRARAEALADAVEPEDLRRLLYFLVDSVLAEEEPPPPIHPDILVPLPLVTVPE